MTGGPTCRPLADRFWPKVDKSGDCWIWTARTGPNGYGRIAASGGGHTFLYAHRVAYELVFGPIPAGMEIDHLCRVRACVRPDHLEAVTHRENVLRGVGITARHAAATHCPQGHPYDEANTLREYGRRRCRTCVLRRGRIRYWRNRGLQGAGHAR